MLKGRQVRSHHCAADQGQCRPAEMGIRVGRVRGGVGSERPSSSCPRLVCSQNLQPTMSVQAQLFRLLEGHPVLSSRRGAKLLPAHALPSGREGCMSDSKKEKVTAV